MNETCLDNGLLYKLDALYQRIDVLRGKGRIGLAEALTIYCIKLLELPNELNKNAYCDDFPTDTKQLISRRHDEFTFRLAIFKLIKGDIQTAIALLKPLEKYEDFLFEILVAQAKDDEIIEMCLNKIYRDKNIYKLYHFARVLYNEKRFDNFLKEIDNILNYDSINVNLTATEKKLLDKWNLRLDDSISYLKILEIQKKYKIEETFSLSRNLVDLIYNIDTPFLEILFNFLSKYYGNSEIGIVIRSCYSKYPRLSVVLSKIANKEKKKIDEIQKALNKNKVPLILKNKNTMPYSSTYQNRGVKIEYDYKYEEFLELINSNNMYVGYYHINDPIRDVLSKTSNFKEKHNTISKLVVNPSDYLNAYEPYGYILYLFLNMEYAKALNLLRNNGVKKKESTILPAYISNEGILNLHFNLIAIQNLELTPEDIFLYKDFFLRKQTKLIAEFKSEALDKIKNILNPTNSEHRENVFGEIKSSSRKCELNSVFGDNLLLAVNISDDIPLVQSNEMFYYLPKVNENIDWIKRLVPLFDEVENDIRAQHGILKIGEGSYNEAFMLDYLRKEFINYEVVSQASPEWLGRQRFDAFIPSLNLAIEYQGIQHFTPIEYFGGVKEFEYIKKLDMNKKQLAEKNSVTVEYILYNENIGIRVREIKNKYIQ